MNQEEENIRNPDLQFTESLIDNESGVNSEAFAINETHDSCVTRDSCVSRHGKTQVKETPRINYSEVNWFPHINRREWHEHTSKMIFIEWMPLTYFLAAGLVTSINVDRQQCSAYANHSMENIMMYVFGPILAMRMLGFVFMDKPNLIVYQIMIIYSYLAISLGYWEYSTM